MDTIPKAEEFLSENINRTAFPFIDEMIGDRDSKSDTIIGCMIEFAKMHVKEALKNFVIMENDRIKDHRVVHKLTENVIKHIYPLENIK